MPNISKIKGHKAIKFGLLIKYNVRNIFVLNLAENETRIVLDLLFFKKSLRAKQEVSILNLIYFGRPQLGHSIKTNCIAFHSDC